MLRPRRLLFRSAQACDMPRRSRVSEGAARVPVARRARPLRGRPCGASGAGCSARRRDAGCARRPPLLVAAGLRSRGALLHLHGARRRLYPLQHKLRSHKLDASLRERHRLQDCRLDLVRRRTRLPRALRSSSRRPFQHDPRLVQDLSGRGVTSRCRFRAAKTPIPDRTDLARGAGAQALTKAFHGTGVNAASSDSMVLPWES